MYVLYSFTQKRDARPARPVPMERHEIRLTPAMTVAAGIAAMVLTSAVFLLG